MYLLLIFAFLRGGEGRSTIQVSQYEEMMGRYGKAQGGVVKSAHHYYGYLPACLPAAAPPCLLPPHARARRNHALGGYDAILLLLYIAAVLLDAQVCSRIPHQLADAVR